METFYFQYGKRVCDIFLAVLLLIAMSWLILIVLILYVVMLEFPIIFRHERIGKSNAPFMMFKFRTLLNEGVALQDRRFALGNFLRLTNADELPQLWNVLKGEMSLVGPRPLPLEYEPFFTQEQRARHSVRPGITGYAQVYGKNSISWEQKFNYDLVYIKKITFKTDLKILLKTITLVLSMKRDESLLEEKFKG